MCIVLKPNAVEILDVHFGLLKQKNKRGKNLQWILFESESCMGFVLRGDGHCCCYCVMSQT